MKYNLPLDKMNVHDKISTMELLWDDICRNTPDFTSPSWHEEILMEREKKIKQGIDDFIDWDVAKKNIRDLIA
ncbi:addiction module protein [Desulfobacula sp.]|uniref:addiction module protein n=1 Tax=Desulfobacula sp. TaxID=2593537 RepID=UPI002714E058|nr:addiction module protein [Desulfobacula sp.]